MAGNVPQVIHAVSKLATNNN